MAAAFYTAYGLLEKTRFWLAVSGALIGLYLSFSSFEWGYENNHPGGQKDKEENWPLEKVWLAALSLQGWTVICLLLEYREMAAIYLCVLAGFIAVVSYVIAYGSLSDK